MERTVKPQVVANHRGALLVVAVPHYHPYRVAGPEAGLVAKGNCGIPEFLDGHIHYNGTPEIMADYARMARDAGARRLLLTHFSARYVETGPLVAEAREVFANTQAAEELMRYEVRR